MNNNILPTITTTNGFYTALNMNNKKKVLIFGSETCAPCKQIEPTIKEYMAYYTTFDFLKIDVEKCQDIADLYKIRITPTFILLKENISDLYNSNNIIETIVGARVDELKTALQQFTKIIDETPVNINKRKYTKKNTSGKSIIPMTQNDTEETPIRITHLRIIEEPETTNQPIEQTIDQPIEQPIEQEQPIDQTESQTQHNPQIQTQTQTVTFPQVPQVPGPPTIPFNPYQAYVNGGAKFINAEPKPIIDTKPIIDNNNNNNTINNRKIETHNIDLEQKKTRFHKTQQTNESSQTQTQTKSQPLMQTQTKLQSQMPSQSQIKSQNNEAREFIIKYKINTVPNINTCITKLAEVGADLSNPYLICILRHVNFNIQETINILFA